MGGDCDDDANIYIYPCDVIYVLNGMEKEEREKRKRKMKEGMDGIRKERSAEITVSRQYQISL